MVLNACSGHLGFLLEGVTELGCLGRPLPRL